MASTKMKLKSAGDSVQALVLANHPMETGTRKDKKTGSKIPAHWIQKMVFSLNGTAVAQANLGTGISKNPLVGAAIKGAKTGDTVSVSWSDNKGGSGSVEGTVK